MNKTVLHLIVDPLCGWTYAATDLFTQIIEVPNLTINVMHGGMLAFDRKRKIDINWKNFVAVHDQRIAKVSGQKFGDGYQRLLEKEGHILDSEPASKAMLAAGNKALELLIAIQRSHFYLGNNINDIEVLTDLATELGMKKEEFQLAYNSIDSNYMSDHFQTTNKFLNSVGGSGYPTAVIEMNGHYQIFNIDRYYDKPELCRKELELKLLN